MLTFPGGDIHCLLLLCSGATYEGHVAREQNGVITMNLASWPLPGGTRGGGIVEVLREQIAGIQYPVGAKCAGCPA